MRTIWNKEFLRVHHILITMFPLFLYFTNDIRITHKEYYLLFWRIWLAYGRAGWNVSFYQMFFESSTILLTNNVWRYFEIKVGSCRILEIHATRVFFRSISTNKFRKSMIVAIFVSMFNWWHMNLIQNSKNTETFIFFFSVRVRKRDNSRPSHFQVFTLQCFTLFTIRLYFLIPHCILLPSNLTPYWLTLSRMIHIHM